MPPFFAAYSFSSVQYGMTLSCHCHLTRLEKSVGHGQVTQLGYCASSLSPGQPLKLITVFTPSSQARRILSRISWSCSAAIRLLGCKGLPWQESALMPRPRASTALRNFFSLGLF